MLANMCIIYSHAALKPNDKSFLFHCNQVGENYQMKTIKCAKAVNPKLAAVFYLNTLYDFPFLELHGKFLEVIM